MKTYETTRGITVGFLPITALLEKLQAAHQPPAPPEYEVKLAGGGTERHAHDETTLETDADRAAWAEYKAQYAAYEHRYQEALTRLVVLHGLKVDAPANDDWAEAQEELGISVPLEPRARRLHWLTTEVLAGPDDYLAILRGVMAASGVPEEDLAQASATFRGDMGTDANREVAPASNGERMENVAAL